MAISQSRKRLRHCRVILGQKRNKTFHRLNDQGASTTIVAVWARVKAPATDFSSLEIPDYLKTSLNKVFKVTFR